VSLVTAGQFSDGTLCAEASRPMEYMGSSVSAFFGEEIRLMCFSSWFHPRGDLNCMAMSRYCRCLRVFTN
jgi:hypothetical protein